MIVCICHRVSDRDIAREVRAGTRSFAALQQALRLATGCGACRDCARATFEKQCRGTPEPHAAAMPGERPAACRQPAGQAA